MAKVHVIPHTHWDREWYFSEEDSSVLLYYDLDDILDILENNNNFNSFLLDGQVSIIEDYLNVKPENKERIKKLVESGRLLIGPWYTQTDEMVVSGESIVRNLLYGTELSNKAGGYMAMGYLPDSFGQSCQMPQIFRGFDFDSVVLWRGISDLDTGRTEFNWESPDGSRVFAYQMRLGYSIGQNLRCEIADINGRVIKTVDKLAKMTDTGCVMLPNGGDQVPVQKDLSVIINRLNEIDTHNEYVISNFPDAIRELKDSGANFKTITGEFTKPKTMRVHKSIYSSRYDLKKLNSDAENRLTMAVEPAFTVGSLFGFEYPGGLIERAWKLILKNQAHDSIGGCNSDSTNDDIKNRAKKANEIIDGTLNIIFKKMIRSIKSTKDGFKLMLFNSLPYKRDMVMKCELVTENKNFAIFKGDSEIEFTIEEQSEIKGGIYTYATPEGEKTGSLPSYFISKVYIKADSIPAAGYDVYYIQDSKNNSEILQPANDNFIENEYYRVCINKNGSVSIYDKKNNSLIDGCLVFEDNGNDGDEYNYSPPDNDLYISSVNSKCEMEVYKSKYVQKAVIRTVLKVPSDLDKRKSGVLDEQIPIVSQIVLDTCSQAINFNVEIDNNAKDHRLRVLFNTMIKSDHSYADTQFGIIKRGIDIFDQLKDNSKEPWKEVPVNIEPMLSMVELNDGNRGTALLTKGIKEYQIIGDENDTIALTLMSTTGVLGKDNLLLRPGRASGISNTTVYTPSAELLGRLQFEFALYMHEGGIENSRAQVLAKELNSPVISYEDQNLCTFRHRLDRFELNAENIEMPEAFSLFELDNNLILSGLKKAEDGRGYIIRVSNPGLEKINPVPLKFNIKVDLVETNLSERLVGSLKTGSIFDLGTFNPCQVKTFRVNPNTLPVGSNPLP